MRRDSERSALGDEFDRKLRQLDGLPDVTMTKATTVRCKTALELTQTFIVQTLRQSEEGDTIFLEYLGRDGSFRLAVPVEVANVISRQRRSLNKMTRSKAGKRRAAEMKAAGIVPGFMR